MCRVSRFAPVRLESQTACRIIPTVLKRSTTTSQGIVRKGLCDPGYLDGRRNTVVSHNVLFVPVLVFFADPSMTLSPPTEPKPSFTTAYAMLLYNVPVRYLAPIPRASRYPPQAGDAQRRVKTVTLSSFVILLHPGCMLGPYQIDRTRPHQVYYL